jgi:putative transposase
MNRDYARDAHRVHLVLYHFVWCPKRRRPVLIGAVAPRLAEILRGVATEQGWRIEHLAILPDHIHMFVQGTPTTPAHEMVRRFKGRSSHDLRIEFPFLLRLPSLWTRSYFCATAGNVSAEAIQRYIDAQAGQ